MAERKPTTARRARRAVPAMTVGALPADMASQLLKRERHGLEIIKADLAHLANLISVSCDALAKLGNSPEVQDVGERVEFLARMLHQQADELRQPIGAIELVADRLAGRPA